MSSCYNTKIPLSSSSSPPLWARCSLQTVWYRRPSAGLMCFCVGGSYRWVRLRDNDSHGGLREKGGFQCLIRSNIMLCHLLKPFFLESKTQQRFKRNTWAADVCVCRVSVCPLTSPPRPSSAPSGSGPACCPAAASAGRSPTEPPVSPPAEPSESPRPAPPPGI